MGYDIKVAQQYEMAKTDKEQVQSCQEHNNAWTAIFSIIFGISTAHTSRLILIWTKLRAQQEANGVLIAK